MATITGTYTAGQIVKTQSFKIGGMRVPYWNNNTGSSYLYNNILADFVAAVTVAPSNLLTLEWPNPLSPVNTDQWYDNTETYIIDNERKFDLVTQTMRTMATDYPYTLQLKIRIYYQNREILTPSCDLRFTSTQWVDVLSNAGDHMLDSFSLRVENPAFSIYSEPVVSPSEDYTDYTQYTLGSAVRYAKLGTYTDLPSQAFGYRGSTAGVTGSVITDTWIGNIYWIRFLWDIEEPKIPTSEPDEEFGGYNNDSQAGLIPDLPSVDMVLTGLVRLYQPTAGQMVDFSDFLWAMDWTDFQKIINSLKQWFSNPLESIVSVNMLPIDYFYDYNAGTAVTPSNSAIIMGGYDTGCVAPACGGNFKQVDCGTISLAPYFKSFLDCNPYTKYTIYLPYIGFREIDSNVLFAPDGANLHVVYNVDIITGCFTCFLHVTKENAGTELSHVLYSYSGNMATQVPLSAANMNDFIRTLGQAASGVALAAATGGASTAIAGVGARTLMGGASSSDYNISHGGNLSMESGYLGIQYPYLIVERPRESFPDGYLHTLGKPSDLGGKLSDFSGFVVVKECHLDGVPATDEEKNEIMNLLKQGVIV